MVVFNPAVPDTNDPSYLALSRPITQPESDKSAVYLGKSAEYKGEALKNLGESEYYKGKGEQYKSAGYGELFKGFGDLIQSGTRAADAYYKSKIDADVYSAVDAERQTFTQQLEQMGAGSTSTVPAGDDMEFSSQNKRRGGSGDILSPEAGGTTPEGIDRGIRDVNSIVSARANDKISETMYIQRLNSIAKSLRAQYPGHREYIDQQIAQATGMNPANSYIRAMIRDMDAASTAAKASANKIENILLDGVKHIPGFQNIYLAVKNNEMDPMKGLEIYNKEMAWKFTYEKIKAGREFRQGTLEEGRIDDNQNLSVLANQKISTFFDSFLARISPDTLTKLRNGDFTGIDPVEIRKVSSAVLAAKEGAYNAVWGEAVKLGYTQSNSIGAEEVQKRIRAQLSTFDTFANLINNQNGGAAMAHADQVKAMLEDTTGRFFKDKDMGAYNRMVAVAAKNGGDKAVEKIVGASLSAGELQTNTRAFLNREKLKYVTGEINPETGAAYTPNDQMKAARAAGLNNVPAYGKSVVDQLKIISDPQVAAPMKTAMIAALGSEQNKGFVTQFSKDRWNTPDGRYREGAKWVPGKYEVYKLATAPNIIAEVKKQSPEIQRGYIDWAESTFSKELWGRELKDLQTYVQDKHMVITYNSELKRFDLKEAPPAPTTAVDPETGRRSLGGVEVRDPARFEYAKQNVERLNDGISGLKNVAELRGMDVDAYIYRTLRVNGVSLEGTSIPSGMMRSMRSNFAAEENPQRGSLSDFLNNPAGVVAPKQNNASTGSKTRKRGNLSDEEVISIGVEDISPGQPIPSR